ncbi:heat shock factor protein 5 isoform X1 [Misgurnus anguillicaudatus]|uniref:heat shock factor protein 5 isoform X1 n=1 Tax=Misgurnus anguillicaudatus TaxID=75329 RepID=UPI003CCF0375
METEGSVFKLPISQNTFPAKLWKLVNDPHNSSVTWSPDEDGVIINQQQFEIELMLPVKQNPKLFKTTNFHSFIRQLNLYGFRKMLDDSSKARQLHHFYNPNFRKDQPELLVNLKRLTINNRVKMCGEMDCAPRSIRRKSEHITADENQGSVHPYQFHGAESYQLKSHDQTLIASHPLIFHYGDVSPFYIDKGIPVSVFNQNPPDSSHGFAFTHNTMLLHQEPKYIPVPFYSTYTPRYFPTAICQCSRSCFMDVDRTGFGQYSFAPYGYFQQNYSVNEPHIRSQTQDWIPKDRGDINLDTVFQMVDEFQGLPNVDIVQVDSPVKPQHTFGLSDPSGSAFYTLPALSELKSLNDQSSRPNTVSLSSVPSLDSVDGACRRSTDNINLEAYKQYNDIMSKYSVNQVLHSSSKERIISTQDNTTLGK